MRNAERMHLMKVRLPTHETQHSIDLPATFVATERERQLTTARASQTAGLNNGRAANWAPEVAFVLSARFPVVN